MASLCLGYIYGEVRERRLIDQMQELHPIVQAGLAGGFTWLVTALGAAIVLFVARPGFRFLDTMLGFAAGVMIAASVWSLLIPAIEHSEGGALPSWLPAAAGLLIGAGFLWLIDQILPHIHSLQRGAMPEGVPSAWRQTTLLIMAITLHNIPEGIAVALPLRGEGFSSARALWYGQLSAAVEPAAAVIGAAAIVFISPILPWALAFAAGAMIYVVVEELIPRSHSRGNSDLATLGTIVGFTLMMILDVALG